MQFRALWTMGQQALLYTSFYTSLGAGIVGYTATGCRVTQEQRLAGEARATITIEYPAAEACFRDVRLATAEELLQCLEHTTGQRFVIDATGAIVEELSEAMGNGAAVPPTNVLAGEQP